MSLLQPKSLIFRAGDVEFPNGVAVSNCGDDVVSDELKAQGARRAYGTSYKNIIFFPPWITNVHLERKEALTDLISSSHLFSGQVHQGNRNKKMIYFVDTK
jgi:hypothetical protein